MNFSCSLTVAVALAALGSAQAGWNRSPYAEERPVDLATSAIPGTKMVSSTGLGNAQSLIDSKISEGVILPAGKSSAVIQLGGQQNIHTVAFNNDGAEGKVAIAGSADNKVWSVLGSAVFSASERVAQVYFAAATVKYVTVSFESAKGGTIRSFQIFGDSTDRDYQAMPGNEGESGSPINLAAAVAGARAIYAFPTPTNVGELNSLHGVFQFPRSRDKYCTVIYDLGSTRTVRDFAASYSRRPMRVEVFAFDGLVEKRDWRGKLTFDPAVFNSAQPVAVGEDANGAGHIRITPGRAVSASYIALRFQPDYQTGIASASAPAESRFVASQVAVGALTVGAIEFLSDREYNVIRVSADQMPEPSALMLGRNARGTGTVDPYIAAAFSTSASTLHRSLPSQTASNADSSKSASNASNPVNKGSTPNNNTGSATAKVAAGAPAAAAASNGTDTPPHLSNAPYVPGEAGSPTSKLVKSFSNKFEAGSSRRNNHGRRCDHCYYCDRGGRCNRCGGHDDDHDSDHDGHDDNGGDHDDHNHDHGNDHGPPQTP